MDDDCGPVWTHKEHHLSGATHAVKTSEGFIPWGKRRLLYKIIRANLIWAHRCINVVPEKQGPQVLKRTRQRKECKALLWATWHHHCNEGSHHCLSPDTLYVCQWLIAKNLCLFLEPSQLLVQAAPTLSAHAPVCLPRPAICQLPDLDRDLSCTFTFQRDSSPLSSQPRLNNHLTLQPWFHPCRWSVLLISSVQTLFIFLSVHPWDLGTLLLPLITFIPISVIYMHIYVERDLLCDIRVNISN